MGDEGQQEKRYKIIFLVSQEFSLYVLCSSYYIGLVGTELGMNKSTDQWLINDYSEAPLVLIKVNVTVVVYGLAPACCCCQAIVIDSSLLCM